jgi:hypothetical protein
MKAFRYNCKKREDRKFNTLGSEKNPNGLKFYGKTLDYANNYRFILDQNNEIVYECSLEVKEIVNVSLFDMESNFDLLSTFNLYVNQQVNIAQSNALFFARVSGKKQAPVNVDQIKFSAKTMDFQNLSDFEMQNNLVAELKSLGFDGYETKNEIVLL